MTTPFQRQVELRILHHLHARHHFGNGTVSADGMYNWFCKDTNVSRGRFDDALASLCERGYFVESEVDGTKQWRMSPFGVDWVEDYYVFSHKDPKQQVLSYSPRFEGTVMIGSRRQDYLNKLAAQATGHKVALDINKSAHWTRSGAIAAWLALPIAIIAILVTMIWSK